MMLGRGRRTRIFFASDLHGSTECFLKWLNAAPAYGADVLILGGDVTGKILVPLVRRSGNGHWQGEISGRSVSGTTKQELDAAIVHIRALGNYPVVLSDDEKRELESDQARVQELFDSAVASRITEWVERADAKLESAGTAAFVMLGNDDEPGLADILRNSQRLTYAEDRLFELAGGWTLASLGYSNPTPWETPREVSESELGVKIAETVSGMPDYSRAIFNFHCPPFNSHLDQAPALTDDLRPIPGVGGMGQMPVGSTAVRHAIENWQPALGLHGHVHESPGAERLGKTTCVNPGSDYADGVLRGAIVTLDAEKGVKGWQLTHG
jgi:Icc-related predicted phosphoesterase